MASGAERAARKRRFQERVAAGMAAAPRVTHFQDSDIRAVVRSDIAELSSQTRERARRGGPARIAPPKTAVPSSAPKTRQQQAQDVLLDHLTENAT